ncbi:MAG: DNA polymerase III subunit [Chloroflexi bacterium]|nr:DNA polymerase III subunit [Chloroflexota bacterium]
MARAVSTPSDAAHPARRPARFATRGHDAAAAHLAALLADAPPHALLIVGPRGAGAGTLARDAVATLMCDAPVDGGPCGACRACRLIASGSHTDLVLISPSGASDEIGIEPIRALAAGLALFSVEGGRRIALIERADRMNEAAQNALLKTLEEPPSRTHVILAAAEDSRLMPTIRSRCAVIRIGLPDANQASELLAERLGVDAPTAVRLLRMSSGRPGPLIDAEATGDAARAHAQIRRQILDFTATSPHARLGQLGALVADARALLVAGADDGDAADGTESKDGSDDAPDVDAEPKKVSPAKRSAKPTPAERRAAATALLRLWRGVARDLALVSAGAVDQIAFPEDRAEIEAVAHGLPTATWGEALRAIDRALSALRRNGNPELLLDAAALSWPTL